MKQISPSGAYVEISHIETQLSRRGAAAEHPMC